MISRAEDEDEVTGPVSVRRTAATPRRAARVDSTNLLRQMAGAREAGAPGPGAACGEIDLRNAPEIAFFRRRGCIPPRAIRALRARVSRRAPFWGLRCVRCGGRSRCGPNRLPLSPR